VELRDDLEKILFSGLPEDEQEQTRKSIRDEDARQLRRARRSAEQAAPAQDGSDEQTANA
jgi:hypothetical protein